MEDTRAHPHEHSHEHNQKDEHHHQEQEHQRYNFALPIPIHGLESERVSLVPFEPLRHAPAFHTACAPHPTLYRYLPWGPFDTLEDFLAWHRTRIEEDVGSFLFAVFDKNTVRAPSDSPVAGPDTDSPHTLAGIIGFLSTDPKHATTELGYLIIIPRFHGTYVASHAIGLLMRYALDLPTPGGNGGIPEQDRVGGIEGLGLRRVQYQAHASNARSIRAAERLGFIREGVIRWQRVLGPGKEGKSGRDGESVGVREGGFGPGRDTMLLAVCWDDWEGGVREHMDRVMSRVA